MATGSRAAHVSGVPVPHALPVQIPSSGILSFTIYGDGTAWIFVCPTCFRCAFGAQR